MKPQPPVLTDLPFAGAARDREGVCALLVIIDGVGSMGFDPDSLGSDPV